MATTATTWSERTALAQESGRVSLICKYLPVTNHRGTRITVQTYLDNAKWRGIWKVATTHNGAVAVFVSEIQG